MVTDGLLLDTHVLIWAMARNPKLGALATGRIRESPRVFFSAASIWEIRIKEASGKLRPVPGQVEDLMNAGYVELPITARHADMINGVDLPHGDPFDRLLIAQARAERLTFVTADRVILASGQPGLVDART